MLTAECSEEDSITAGMTNPMPVAEGDPLKRHSFKNDSVNRYDSEVTIFFARHSVLILVLMEDGL